MSEGPIATAYVEIKPTPTSIKAFPKTVKTELDAALAKTSFKITLTPVLGTFKQKIQTELRQAKFTVQVTPALDPKFRDKLVGMVQTASKGVTVTVPVIPTGGIVPPAGGTGTGRGGGRGKGGGKASELQLLERRKKLERELAAAVAITTSAEDKKVAVDKALANAEAHLAGLTDRSAAATDLKAKAVVKATSAEIPLVEALVARAKEEAQTAASTVNKEIADKKAAAAAELRTDIETKALAIRKDLAAIDQISLKFTGAVTIARQEEAAASAAVIAATALHDEAVKTLNADLIKETQALKDAAIADQIKRQAALESAVADAKAAGSARKRAAAEEQLFRGGGATLLSRLGARGATLAAGAEFLAGAAIITALGKAVDSASKLEQELNVFQATSQATAAEMEAVSVKAKELGQDLTLPAVNANDAAEAMTELSKAGLSVQDSMDAARGTLQLATAAQLDNKTAVNITASALNAFGLAGTDAVHVADLLAGASNEAQGGIDSMGGALSSVASVARQAGLSVENTIALLTLLAKNGIQGAEAGTALRVALIRLIAPTDKARQTLGDLGVRVRDFNGNVRPEVFADLQRAVDKLSPSMRDAALQTIFGTRAIRAQAVLGREGVQGLYAMADATNQAGLAAELAGARTKGFAGDVESFKNSLSTLGISIGESLIPKLTAIVDTGNEIVGVFQDIIAAKEKLDKKLGEEPGGGGPFEELSKSARDFLGTTGGEVIKQVDAALELFKRGEPADLFKSPLTTLERMNQEIIDSTKNTGAFATELNSIAEKDGINKAVAYVINLRKQLYGSGEEVQKTREYLDGVVRVLTGLGRAPTLIELKTFIKTGSVETNLADFQKQVAQAPPILIEAGFAPDSLVGLDEAARKKALDALKIWEHVFGPDTARLLGEDWMAGFGAGAQEKAKVVAGSVAATLSENLAADLALAMLTPGVGDELAIWQQRLATRQRVLARAKARRKEDPSKKNAELVQEAAALVKEAEDAIKAILEDQKTKSQAAADRITKARNEADQAFLDAMGFERGKKENAVLRAEGTARLQDDIKTHTALRDFLIKSRTEAAKTIKDAQTKAEVIQSLTTDIIQENQTIQDLTRQLVDSLSAKFETRISIASIVGTVGQIRKLYAAWLKELRKAYDEAKKGTQYARDLKLQILQTQQEAFDAINESFELDIQLAEATDNQAKEIKARERYIAQLKKEQSQYRKGTLEWKRLQLEILNQQKAIKDVRQAERDLFHEMSFEFLTRQQGFAATVMSNMLGPVVLTGSVGGTSLPGTGTRTDPTVAATVAAATAAGKIGTRGRFPEGMPRVGLPGGRTGTGLGGAKSPSTQLGYQAADSQAGARGGTPSQFATIIHLLTQMVTILGRTEGRAKHPNNKHSQGAGGSSMDTM